MSKTLKIAAIAAGVLLVLVGIGIYVLHSNLGSIIRAAVETVGSEVAGTPVKLRDAEISIEDGKGTLRGFQVVNPQGFARDDAFRFEEITVVLDTSTVFSNPVIVKEVRVLKPAITYEIAGKDSNVDRIRKNAEGYGKSSSKGEAGQGGAAKPAEKPAAEGKTEDGRKLIIQNVYLTGGTVAVRASSVLDKKLTLPLPDMHLKDIGKKEGGASPAAIAETILKDLGGQITGAVSKMDLSALGSDALNYAKGAGGAAVETISKGAGAAGDAVKSGASDVTKGVKGLFGN